MKAIQVVLSVLSLVPTLSQAQSLKVIDTVTRPEKPVVERSQFHQLGEFKMGRRAVRVRIFVNESINPENKMQYIIDYKDDRTASPQARLISDDPLRNGVSNCLGANCTISSEGIDERYNREELDQISGVVVLPQVLLCTAKALEQVKRFADANPNDFDLMLIDEVNLIMTATNTPKEDYYSLHRSDVAAIPNDPALNYSFALKIAADGSSSCKTVSDANFGAAWTQLVAKAKK